jgi:hypothetical protein
MTSDPQALDSALMVAVDHVFFSCAVTFCAIVLTSEAQIREDYPRAFYLVESLFHEEYALPKLVTHPIILSSTPPHKIDTETDITLTY